MNKAIKNPYHSPEKHSLQPPQEHLPVLNKTKHYLFHSLNRSLSKHNSATHSPETINNLHSRQISICNLLLEEEIQQKSTQKLNSPKSKLNSTWRRIVINSKWPSERADRYELNQKKSETIDVINKKINNDMFTPRLTKKDLSQKNTEVLDKYFHKFLTPSKKQAKKSLNIKQYHELIDRSHYEQLQRLKLTIQNRKIQEKEKLSFLRNKIQYTKANPEKKSKVKIKPNRPSFTFQPWENQFTGYEEMQI